MAKISSTGNVERIQDQRGNGDIVTANCVNAYLWGNVITYLSTTCILVQYIMAPQNFWSKWDVEEKSSVGPLKISELYKKGLIKLICDTMIQRLMQIVSINILLIWWGILTKLSTLIFLLIRIIYFTANMNIWRSPL